MSVTPMVTEFPVGVHPYECPRRSHGQPVIVGICWQQMSAHPSVRKAWWISARRAVRALSGGETG
jgi:hypothetical protein